jgi:hypothetical protein
MFPKFLKIRLLIGKLIKGIKKNKNLVKLLFWGGLTFMNLITAIVSVIYIDNFLWYFYSIFAFLLAGYCYFFKFCKYKKKVSK